MSVCGTFQTANLMYLIKYRNDTHTRKKGGRRQLTASDVVNKTLERWWWWHRAAGENLGRKEKNKINWCVCVLFDCWLRKTGVGTWTRPFVCVFVLIQKMMRRAGRRLLLLLIRMAAAIDSLFYCIVVRLIYWRLGDQKWVSVPHGTYSAQSRLANNWTNSNRKAVTSCGQFLKCGRDFLFSFCLWLILFKRQIDIGYCRLQPNVLRRDWRELPTPRGLAQTQSDAIPLLFDIHHSHTAGPVTTTPGNSAHFLISFFVSEPIHRRHTIDVEISIHSIPHEMPFSPFLFFQKTRHFSFFLGSNWRPSWILFIDQSEMSNWKTKTFSFGENGCHTEQNNNDPVL